MIKIIISGLATQEILDKVTEVGGDQVEARVMADILGATEVAQGKADYFFGACATGGGGALAMAIAILGYGNCYTVSTTGQLPQENNIRAAVLRGTKAFGFTCDHVDTAVPLILKAILANHHQVD